jgi:Ni,Fe-hydrogenase I large subunit
MFRPCMTFTLMFFLLMAGFSSEVSAKTVKKKTKTSKSYVSNSKKKSKKYRVTKNRRYSYKRLGTGPDLRTLTTEKPNTEYIENPDNGVNPVETKPEL